MFKGGSQNDKTLVTQPFTGSVQCRLWARVVKSVGKAPFAWPYCTRNLAHRKVNCVKRRD